MTYEEYNLNPHFCLQCGKPILCQPEQNANSIKQKKFCNHSCAAIYNNTHRKKKQYFCQKCGVLIGEGYENCAHRKCCDKCASRATDWSQISYGYAKSLRLYQVNSRIRELARTKYYKTHPQLKCEICGYAKHVEVHHIKGISTFSDETPVSVINDDSNLIGLCPNHHWEIEHNLLD